MEEELNTKNTEIVEDMPDFEENTAEMPCEDAESVDKCTDDAENAIVSEENADENADTEGETEKKPSRSAEKKESKAKKVDFKSNLPTGLSFNPLVMAIKPFYDKLIDEDEIFKNVVKEREGRKEKPKSLGECADYIMSEAYNYAKEHRNGNFGMAGFPDEDMYRLIRHYYDEEFLEVQKISGAKAVVSSVSTPTSPAKTPAKAKDKPKPVKNVIDLSKVITAKPKAEDGKKVKREKKKDNLNAGFVPMERPETLKDAKKGSREQAKSVEQMDMFADFFAE
jgi:hypothetical protein